ncbi:ataxin-2 homolog [Rhopalosiphum padi]|uniref:ataxin-2 homolog n=1 Tax=Rhopalosiphum padi TaxID=40932 RepID=UPI00298DFF8D|nr:ataxin-2 homolog [Rhopalosiphum padi]
MMCFKAIVLVSAIACLISAEKKSLLKDRIFHCKHIPFKKHSIFDLVIPSIEPSPPVDSAVPVGYTIPTEVTTLGAEPLPTQEPAVPQQEVQYPTQPEMQYPTSQQEAQSPVAPQQEVQNPPQQEVQNPPQQQPLYPPQHEGQRPAQHSVAQNPPSNEGLYPPQHNGQYYPPQNGGQYYQPHNEGLYYPPPNYQGFTNYAPYNYPVYGQNVLRSVKSLDGQTYTTHQRPQRVNMFIRQPTPYYNAPHPYGFYAAPQYNYEPQAPKIPKALLKST